MHTRAHEWSCYKIYWWCLQSVGPGVLLLTFNNLVVILAVQVLVEKHDIPILISMRDVLNKGIYNSLQGRFISLGKRRHSLSSEFCFNSQVSTRRSALCLNFELELRTLYRTSGHPPERSLQELLKRADRSSLDKKTISAMKIIKEHCIIWREIDSTPPWFTLTVRNDGCRFIHCVRVDTMFIESRPVAHMVDEMTHFCAAVILRNQSPAETWKKIQNIWSFVYLGQPDYLVVDHGTAWSTKKMETLRKLSVHIEMRLVSSRLE